LETLERRPRREFLISKTWIQAVLLVVLCGFFVLGLLAYRTYQAQPPIPARVVDQNGGSSLPEATSARGSGSSCTTA
jgi:nitric oxide reductase subunit B